MRFKHSSSRRWSPSASERKEFAIKMQTDPDFANAYNERNAAKIEKRRSNSRFDYSTAGGSYVPTRAQHDFAVFDRSGVMTSAQEDACNMVASAFSCNEKCDHDYIHIVNELIRKKEMQMN